jgi:hypothetical protein
LAHQSDVEHLAALVAQDPGAPAFSVVAEVHRREGQLDDARRVAAAGLAASPDSVAGRIVHALALLDLGETEAARGELVRGIEAVPGHSGLPSLVADAADSQARASLAGAAQGEQATARLPFDARADHTFGDAVADDELDAAFLEAESITDEMHDVNQVAQAAILAEERADAEGGEPDEFDGLAEAEEFQPADHPAFATETMADLLERQGDGQGAQAIRRSLGRRELEPDPERDRVVVELESWLANLRRESA